MDFRTFYRVRIYHPQEENGTGYIELVIERPEGRDDSLIFNRTDTLEIVLSRLEKRQS